MGSREPRSENLTGILLMLAAMALFAVEDLFLKLAAADLPIGQIILISGALGLPVFVGMAWRQGQGILVKDALQPAVIARNLGEMVAAAAYVAALAVVPLGTVASVLQALPLFMTMGAAMVYGETVGWRRWTAILVGFAGVLLVIQPGAEGFRVEALLVLISVAGIVVRDLASRAIPARVTTAQVSAWGLMSVTVLGLGMIAATGDVRGVTGTEALVLLGAVVFGTAGYWAVTAAARTGEVSVVAPFRYSRLVFSMGIGVVFLAERPDPLTLVGAAIIVGSGLYAFARERARKRASQGV
ncbi:DMT family transporter [Tabrizicola sp.]|uniref:DMT family transporter n=1 Tax=Tabrizicola sp. TaxID=2005166 RepID=UPI0025FAC5E5|nr:DMT family transporter [Tabrizicola sp.]